MRFSRRECFIDFRQPFYYSSVDSLTEIEAFPFLGFLPDFQTEKRLLLLSARLCRMTPAEETSQQFPVVVVVGSTSRWVTGHPRTGKRKKKNSIKFPAPMTGGFLNPLVQTLFFTFRIRNPWDHLRGHTRRLPKGSNGTRWHFFKYPFP